LPLDFIPIGYYTHPPVPPFTEGVFMRRHASGVGCGPCGRGTQASHSGGPGPRPGDTTVALGGAPCIGRLRRRFKKHGPGMMAGPSSRLCPACKSRDGAPRGERVDRGPAASRKRRSKALVRRVAPHSLGLRR
jgi:hypothetical protein